MEKLDEINDIVDVGSLKTFSVKSPRKVSDLINDLKLSGKYFAILVDGKKAKLDDTIKEGQSIILLPKIAGG